MLARKGKCSLWCCYEVWSREVNGGGKKGGGGLGEKKEERTGGKGDGARLGHELIPSQAGGWIGMLQQMWEEGVSDLPRVCWSPGAGGFVVGAVLVFMSTLSSILFLSSIVGVQCRVVFLV